MTVEMIIGILIVFLLVIIKNIRFSKRFGDIDDKILSNSESHKALKEQTEQQIIDLAKNLFETNAYIKKRNDEIDRKLKNYYNHASSLSDLIKKMSEEIERVDKENKELRERLEFYEGIKEDSAKMNDSEENERLDRLVEETISKLENGDENSLLALDSEQETAFNWMYGSDENIFITGKAGTGKSYLLKIFAGSTKKKVLILAPTGVAAVNVGGSTIHSAFGYDNLNKLNIDDLNEKTMKLNPEKRSVLKQTDSIIIDEVSMVRSDIFDKMDKILKIVNQNSRLFGGKQMILFGDVFQLPPIVNGNEEYKYLYSKFGGKYFFCSSSYRSGNFHFIELTINHRQKDDSEYYRLLNRIRDDNASSDDFNLLNSRVCGADDERLSRAIRLFPRKEEVERYNKSKLQSIEKEEFIYKAIILKSKENMNIDTNFPVSEILTLKVGASIMMVSNDQEKRWYNGTRGIIAYLDKNTIKVEIDRRIYELSRKEFSEYEAVYDNDTGKIFYKPSCTISQYPLILAYAITIHKSQGKTYNDIACDLGKCFSSGQEYVALSRCTSLDGLHLLNKVYKVTGVDSDVRKFYESSRQVNLLDEVGFPFKQNI